MGTHPLISVLMPMRNAAEYVQQAVHSVLEQGDGPEGVDLELIVVDDGSTDDSAAIVEAFQDSRIRLLPGPERGIPAAMNAALAAARGTFVARCDADDFYMPGRLRSQLDFLQEQPAYGVVCGRFAIVSTRGKVVAELGCTASDGRETASREITSRLRRGQLSASFNTYLIRTRLARSIGGFRDFFISGSDVDFQLRLAEVCRTWWQSRCQYAYRLHDSSITHTQSSLQRQFFEEAARRMQRQRMRGGKDDLQRGRPPVVPKGTAPPSGASEHLRDLLLGQAWREHRSGRRYAALRKGVHALVLDPGRLEIWRSVAALAIQDSETSRAVYLHARRSDRADPSNAETRSETQNQDALSARSGV